MEFRHESYQLALIPRSRSLRRRNNSSVVRSRTETQTRRERLVWTETWSKRSQPEVLFGWHAVAANV